MRILRQFLALTSVLACASACGKSSSATSLNAAGAESCRAGGDSAWCQTFEERDAALNQYLQQHHDDVASFAGTALGINGFPYILLRLLPELFTDAAQTAGENFSHLGLSPNIFDPKSLLPLGLGMSKSPGPGGSTLHLVTLTCGACHIGNVRDHGQNLSYLVGGGNSRFEASALFLVFQKIVNDPNYTAEKVVAAIDSKPDGWFYGTPGSPEEQAERALFRGYAKALLPQFKSGIDTYVTGQSLLINQHMYVPNKALDYFARSPGRADAVGLVIMNYVKGDVGLMPSTPTITKIMSVWAQKDRAVGHWASDMPAGIAPILAGATAVAGSGALVNRDNIVRAANLLPDLPPPPYPFAVDTTLAAKGAQLFADNCASCHKARDSRVFPAEETGTDPARLHALKPETFAGFDQDLHVACPADALPTICLPADQHYLRSLAGPVGYVSTPLDGIWARAPYLHNGSIPTLYHLLVPSQRPAQFVVGSLAYDTEKVGYDWQNPDTESDVYVTGAIGQKNTGHDTPAYLGTVDWEHDDESRDALIEYMKTL